MPRRLSILALVTLVSGCSGRSAVPTTASAEPPVDPREWAPVLDLHTDLSPRLVTHDGRFVVAVAESEVCLLELETGAVRACGRTTGSGGMAMHPSVDRFALGTFGGAIEIWDVATWSRVARVEGHEHNVDDLAWTAGGALLSASWDGTLRRWEGSPLRGRVLQRERREDGRPAWFRALAVHPSGRVAIGLDGRVRIVEGEQTTAELALDDDPAALAYSPTGDVLAIGLRDGSVAFWDGRSAQVSARNAVDLEYVDELVWRDAQHLLVSGRGGPLRLVDRSGAVVRELGLSRRYGGVQLVATPDRATVVVGAEEGIHLLRGEPLVERLVRPVRRRGNTADFHPTEPLLAMATVDRAAIVARLGAPARATAIPAPGEASSITAVAIGPDGSVAIGQPDGAVRLQRPDGEAGPRLEATGTFAFYGFGRGTRSRGESEVFSADPPTHLDWAGDRVAVGTDERVQIFRADTGEREQVIALDSDEREIASLTLSADGQRLAYGAAAGSAWVVNLETRELIAGGPLHSSTISGVAFSPDGTRLATAGQDGFVRVSDLDDGGLLHELEHPDRFVLAVAWSPDGRHLASSESGVVHLWNAETGAHVAAIEGHTQHPWRLGFMQGGRVLASYAGTTLLTDVSSPDRRLTLRGWARGASVGAVVQDGSGRFEALGDARRDLRFRGPGDVRVAPMRGAEELGVSTTSGLAAGFLGVIDATIAGGSE